ncbi:MAG: hypothetical protein M4579_005447, partial [Chaenotheca gracillima]
MSSSLQARGYGTVRELLSQKHQISDIPATTNPSGLPVDLPIFAAVASSRIIVVVESPDGLDQQDHTSIGHAPVCLQRNRLQVATGWYLGGAQPANDYLEELGPARAAEAITKKLASSNYFTDPIT